MSVSTILSLSDANDCYGPILPAVGFHSSMLDAGVRRVERLVAKQFPRNQKFLQLICRSAMTKYGKHAHTILLESFGHPVLALRNLTYSLQPLEERKVYIVYLEQAFANWKVRKSEESIWPTLIIGGLCSLGIGFLITKMHYPIPSIRPHEIMGFYQ